MGVRTAVLCTGLVVLALDSAAQAQDPVTLTSPPTMVQGPTAQDMDRVMPTSAILAGAGGKARISCVLTATGQLDACTVASEEPAGMGFGEAAIALAPKIKFATTTAQGQAVAGAKITLPIAFAAPDRVDPTPRITPPRLTGWIQTPTPAQLLENYPAEALRRGRGGAVDATCATAVDGSLSDCRVVYAFPKDLGLGEAALRMLTHFKAKPGSALKDGRALMRFSFPAIRPAEPTSGSADANGATATSGPDWIRKPGATELGRLYPGRAIKTGQGADVTIQCKVISDGLLRDCVVLHEFPGGLGFGEAALKLSAYFQMKSTTRDGESVDGALVNIPLPFRIN